MNHNKYILVFIILFITACANDFDSCLHECKSIHTTEYEYNLTCESGFIDIVHDIDQGIDWIETGLDENDSYYECTRVNKTLLREYCFEVCNN